MLACRSSLFLGFSAVCSVPSRLDGAGLTIVLCAALKVTQFQLGFQVDPQRYLGLLSDFVVVGTYSPLL